MHSKILKRKPLVTMLMLLIGVGTADFLPERNFINGLFISEAEARVRRPATRVRSVGVARRTTRRVVRRTAYRINVLPTGCVYGPYYGAHYWKCGGNYFLKEGTIYIQVTF